MYATTLTRPEALFGHFERLSRELDDVFGVAGLPRSIRSVAGGGLPAVNVGRTSKSIEVYAFAPGLDPAKIEVTIDRGILRIAGERASSIPTNDAKVNVYARERSTGRFTRTIALPEDIDPAQVEATYRDGVLKVSVARREPVQPQRIAVQ